MGSPTASGFELQQIMFDYDFFSNLLNGGRALRVTVGTKFNFGKTFLNS